MYAFEYHRPTSLRQAASLLSKSEDAKIIAGGHTLLPTMKQRLAAPGSLVDLAEISELKGIERDLYWIVARRREKESSWK